MAKVFSEAQNAALRDALREIRGRRHYSQVALGNVLGIKQQNVSRLLVEDAAGFSYESALRLVRLMGFRSVETFFERRAVALPKSA